MLLTAGQILLIDKIEVDIFFQMTLAIDPALGLDRIRLMIDFWISSDGPEVVAINL